MKGKERENSMSVYLSVLKERGQGLEKVGRADGGSGVGGAAMHFALRHRTCLFQGETNKKEKLRLKETVQ